MSLNTKVSIITVCFNAEETILDTLASVASQTHPNIEHIIVDGNSSDNTIGIVKNNIIDQNVVVSEDDEGLYDAMNKGLRLATGDLIAFLNADNVYDNSEVVSLVVRNAMECKSDVVYGNAEITSPIDLSKTKRIWIARRFKMFKLYFGWMPPHQTMFVSKPAFEQVNEFDTQFKIAADYDFILRLLQVPGIRSSYIPSTLVRARGGGVSNKNLKFIFISNLEVVKSWKKNKGWRPYYLILLKPISKIVQIVTAKLSSMLT